jgi:nucleotide-binding universal stress UspA family protein
MFTLRKILVPHDFSSHSDAALRRAVALAGTTRARLHLLHACAVPVAGLTPYEMVVPTGVWDAIREGAAERLEEIRRDLARQGVEAEVEVSSQLPVEAILASAEETHADLIAMGTRGRTGLKHAMLGSVAERTLRHAPCPVLAVKAEDPGGPPRRVVVAVDFSAPGDHACDVGVALAERFAAEVHLVHAFDMPPAVLVPYDMGIPETAITAARAVARRKLDAAVARARAAGVEATGHLVDVPAAQGISDLARELKTDLVVIGTHGHTGLRHVLLGSTAERTLRLAPCAVLTVRGSDMRPETRA